MYLVDWQWHLLGRRLVRDFNPEQVNPSSYDVRLSTEIKLQKFQGVEYDDLPATLYRDNAGLPRIRFCKGLSSTQAVDDRPALFYPGDAILGVTVEYFTIPRFCTTEFRLKSSAARAGVTHRLAVWAENGFRGNLVLELDFVRSCYLYPDRFIGQMIASITPPALRPYRSRYQGQTGVVSSRNTTTCSVVAAYTLKGNQ